jgi:DNA-binding NarL/FixJ family response regulator
MEHDHNEHARTIRVLVADNSPFHTHLLANTLKRDPDLQVVSSELNGASLLATSIGQKIDVFVLGSFGDGKAQRGFQALQELRETNPHARAVMLLDSPKADSILEAFRAGAKGVFDHQGSPEILSLCIRRVHEGQAWVSHEQMALVLDALASRPKIRTVDQNGMELLSEREAEVVRSLAEGLTNREIAQRMGLSQHTIKNHLFRIFDKLGVSNRIELLFMTLSQGTAAPVLLQGLPMDPADRTNLLSTDDATLGLCQKAAEQGVAVAQLALARMLSEGPASKRDLIRAHMWFCVAIDELTRMNNNVKAAMNPAQLAEAVRRVHEYFNTSRGTKASCSSETSSIDERTRKDA